MLKVLSTLFIIGLVLVAAIVGGVFYYGQQQFHAAGPALAEGAEEAVTTSLHTPSASERQSAFATFAALVLAAVSSS